MHPKFWISYRIILPGFCGRKLPYKSRTNLDDLVFITPGPSKIGKIPVYHVTYSIERWNRFGGQPKYFEARV